MIVIIEELTSSMGGVEWLKFLIEVLVGITAIVGLFMSIKNNKESQQEKAKDNKRYLYANMPMVFMSFANNYDSEIPKHTVTDDNDYFDHISIHILNSGRLPAKNINIRCTVNDRTTGLDSKELSNSTIRFNYDILEFSKKYISDSFEGPEKNITRYENVGGIKYTFDLNPFAGSKVFLGEGEKIDMTKEDNSPTSFHTIYKYALLSACSFSRYVNDKLSEGGLFIELDIEITYEDFIGNKYETIQKVGFAFPTSKYYDQIVEIDEEKFSETFLDLKFVVQKLEIKILTD